MLNNIILTPSVLFYENQNLLLDGLFENNLEVKEFGKKQFLHFSKGGNDFTYHISSKYNFIVYIVKGHYESDNFDKTDIIFKNSLNVIASAERNGVVLNDEMLKKLDSTCLKPSYLSLSLRQAPTSYSTFNEDDFDLLLDLFENEKNKNIVEEMRVSYKKESKVVSLSIKNSFKDLFIMFNDEKLTNKRRLNNLMENGFLVKIEDMLIYDRDSYVNFVHFNEDEIIFYEIDKDVYHLEYNDEDYNEDLICYNRKEYFNKLSKVKLTLNENNEIARIKGDKITGLGQELFLLIGSMLDTKNHLFKKYKIIDERKKMSPKEFKNPYYMLLSANNCFWLDGTIYNPNKVLGIDIEDIMFFEEEPAFDYIFACSNELMLNYKKNVSSEWLACIDTVLKYVKEVPSDKSVIYFQDNLDKMIAYREKGRKNG